MLGDLCPMSHTEKAATAPPLPPSPAAAFLLPLLLRTHAAAVAAGEAAATVTAAAAEQVGGGTVRCVQKQIDRCTDPRPTAAACKPPRRCRRRRMRPTNLNQEFERCRLPGMHLEERADRE